MKTLKKILIALFGVTMIASFAACSDDDDDSDTGDTSYTDTHSQGRSSGGDSGREDSHNDDGLIDFEYSVGFGTFSALKFDGNNYYSYMLIFNFSIPNWEAANKKGVGEFAIVAKCLNGDILTKDTQKGQQHGDMFVKTEIVDGLKCKVFTGAATTLSGTSKSWTCDMYCEAKYNYIDIKYTQRYYNTKTKQYITGPFWHEKRIYAVEYKK